MLITRCGTIFVQMAVMQTILLHIKSMTTTGDQNADALKRVLATLQRRSGKVAEVQSYTITSHEIEKIEKVGFGGFSGEYCCMAHIVCAWAYRCIGRTC